MQLEFVEGEITCHTHVILRTDALRVLKQNWGKESVRGTTVWSLSKTHDTTVRRCFAMTFWPRPHKTRKLPPESVSSDIVTAKVEGPDKICYDDI